MFDSNRIDSYMDTDDPFDFPEPSERPGLRDLDASMRCTICQELYDGPVTLVCGHCFCSLCIRKSLAEKAECPHCRKTSSDVHIRPNPAIEQVVQAWKSARPCILQLLKEAAELITQNKAAAEAHPIDFRPAKRRKRSRSATSEISSSIELIETSATNSVSSASPRKRPASKSRSKHGKSAHAIPISESGEEDIETDHKPVGCPVCQKQVLYHRINAHIDSGCSQYVLPSGRRPASSSTAWQDLFDKKAKGKERLNGTDEGGEPLPKLAYNTLKEKTIREHLSEYDLPTTGDKSTLIARHKQWVMLYNANFDKSVKRKTLRELRNELKKWEEGLKTKKVVVEDTVAHEKRYGSDFKALVQAARRKPPPLPLPKEQVTPPPPSSPQSGSTPVDGPLIIPD